MVQDVAAVFDTRIVNSGHTETFGEQQHNRPYEQRQCEHNRHKQYRQSGKLLTIGKQVSNYETNERRNG